MKKKRVRKGIVVSFGANDSKNPKNDICLYRVYTYARKLDKSISTTYGMENICHVVFETRNISMWNMITKSIVEQEGFV